MTSDFDIFAGWTEKVKTPCYIIDTDILTKNLKAIKAKSDKAAKA